MENTQETAQAADAPAAPAQPAALLVTKQGPVTPPRRPDAIKAPRTFVQGNDIGEQATHLASIFKPMLGTPQITLFNQGSFIFLAPDSKQTLLFPHGHPRAGQPRYTWMTCTDLPASMAGHDIQFGHLVDGANPDGESTAGVPLVHPIDERRAMYKRLSDQGLLDANTTAELMAQLDEEEKRANAKAQ